MSALKSAVRGEVNMRFDFSQLLFLPPAAAGAVSPVSRWENEKFRNPKHSHSNFAPVEARCSVLPVKVQIIFAEHNNGRPTSDFFSLNVFRFHESLHLKC